MTTRRWQQPRTAAEWIANAHSAYEAGYDADEAYLPRVLHALEVVLDIHYPADEPGQGYRPDSHEYGSIYPCCIECGTDEYARLWPCPTVRAIEAALGVTP